MNSDEFADRLKSDFEVSADLSDCRFSNANVKRYYNTEKGTFGEKLCLLYMADLLIYNVNFNLKILSFNYEKSFEILKLEIGIEEVGLEKEILSCKNYLQRNRNLNLALNVLIQFARNVESRRLIKEIIFLKSQRLHVKQLADGGMEIQCTDIARVYFTSNWKIDWNLKEQLIIDSIEFYHANFEGNEEIREKMEYLSQPVLDFQTKLKTWTSLMELVHQYINSVTPVVEIEEPDVLVISDTEDDNNNFGMLTSDSKRRRLDRPQSSSVILILD